MRAIIDYLEFDAQSIQPDVLLAEYRRLVEADVARYFVAALRTGAGQTAEVDGVCPACGSEHSRPAFSRFGLSYADCGDCGTLWVAPAPTEQMIRHYYAHSEAERFWQRELAGRTTEARLTKVIQPRLDWIADSLAEYRSSAEIFADIGTHFRGHAERFVAMGGSSRHLAVDPIADLSGIDGLDVVEARLVDAGLSGTLDAASLFDVLDRTPDPAALMAAVRDALKPGGLVFLTGILSSGFEIQTLWDRADAVFPPDRLNLMSVKGLTRLIEAAGLEILEFSTPGALDLARVIQARKVHADLTLPRFVETLLDQRGEAEYGQFQGFLQASLLSSFARIVARLPA